MPRYDIFFSVGEAQREAAPRQISTQILDLKIRLSCFAESEEPVSGKSFFQNRALVDFIGNNSATIGRQSGGDRPLFRRNTGESVEIFQMTRCDRVDQRHIRQSAQTQGRDLPGTARPHFNDGKAMLQRQAKEILRHSDLVVGIALGGEDDVGISGSADADRAQHFLDAGFADTASDTENG